MSRPALAASAGVTINSFTALPATIALGDETTLSWSAKNSATVQIDDNVGQVRNRKSVSGSGNSDQSPDGIDPIGLSANRRIGVMVVAPPFWGCW